MFFDNLVSCLTTGVAYHQKKDVLDNVVYVCNNDTNDHMTPDLETNITHVHIPDIAHTSTITPASSLLPYPSTALPNTLQCITGIDFTYHPTLWNNHATWINLSHLFLNY